MGSCCKPEEYTIAQQHVTGKPGDAIHESVKVCANGMTTGIFGRGHTLGVMLLWSNTFTRQSDIWSCIPK